MENLKKIYTEIKMLFFNSFILSVFERLKGERYYIIKNTDIEKNLLFYNIILKQIASNKRKSEETPHEQLYQMKQIIVANVTELYFIIKMHKANDLLNSVYEYINIQIKILEEKKNDLDKILFAETEMKFLHKVIEFLEKKQNNNEKMPLGLKDFIDNFSQIIE